MEDLPDPSIILIFSTSFVVAFSGALMPGPLLAVDITESGRRGFWAGPLVVAGHGLAELVLIFAVLAGLAQLLESDTVLATIGIMGGLFLLWMGYDMIRTAPQRSLPQRSNTGNSAESVLGPVISGAWASVSNPYWWLWWATAGLTYMIWSKELGIAAVGFFALGHIMGDLVWYSGVSSLIATGRKWINDNVYHLILCICGIFLIVLSLYFIISGISFVVR